MAIFGPKPWVNPFGKMLIFGLFELLVFIAQKGVFPFQNIVKDIFLAYTALKKQLEKCRFFGPKPWVYPFGKLSIFRLFELLVFIAQKGVFPFQNIVKDIFLDYIPLKTKLEKWPFLNQNHGLTRYKKMSIFGLFKLLVFVAQKGVCSLQNILKNILLAYIA